ncbi:MAG: ribosome-associated protein [Paracoccaceae bacterium]|jgi:ribosome-associated protein
MLYQAKVRRHGLESSKIMTHYLMEDTVLSEHVDAVKGSTATGGVNTAADDKIGGDLLHLILETLDSNKAEDVISIPLKGKSEMADFMVIASGRSSRQVIALAEKLSDQVKHDLGRLSRMEGKQTGDWVLVDCGDVVVHIFRPEVRDFYQLEKMWVPATMAIDER